MRRILVPCAALLTLSGAIPLCGCNPASSGEANLGSPVIEHTNIKQLPPGALEQEQARQRERAKADMQKRKTANPATAGKP